MEDDREPQVLHLRSKEEIVATLKDLIARGERGERVSAAFRLHWADGTYEDVTIGFEEPQQADVALASVHKALGHLN